MRYSRVPLSGEGSLLGTGIVKGTGLLSLVVLLGRIAGWYKAVWCKRDK